MITGNNNEALANGREEEQRDIEIVLERRMRLQQEEMRREINNLRDEMRNFLSKVESTSDSDAIPTFSDNLPQDLPVEQQQDVESQPSAASGRQRPRRTGGSSPLSNILRRNRSRSSNQSLPEDIFTMMMMSRPCSASWALGIFVWACQMSLCFLIMIELGHEAGIVGSFLSGYNWLTRPDATVYIGQFISIIFVTLAQGDMFSSVRTIQWLRKNTRWDIILLGKEENEDPPSIWDWILHILIPNVLKFIQGFAVFFVSFFIIMTRSNLLDLIKDFTSLMIVSELDNIAFDFTAYGYLGESLYLKTIDAQDIEIDDIAQQQGGRFIFRKLWAWVLLGLTLAIWCYFFTVYLLKLNGWRI